MGRVPQEKCPLTWVLPRAPQCAWGMGQQLCSAKLVAVSARRGQRPSTIPMAIKRKDRPRAVRRRPQARTHGK